MHEGSGRTEFPQPLAAAAARRDPRHLLRHHGHLGDLLLACANHLRDPVSVRIAAPTGKFEYGA
jgi:hypothetical protein